MGSESQKLTTLMVRWGLMLKIFDTVMIIQDVKDEGLTAGEVGTIIYILDKEKEIYEVEFPKKDLKTVALQSKDIKLIDIVP